MLLAPQVAEIQSSGKLGQPVQIHEVIRLLTIHGWQLVATRGSHRQFKHPDRPGRVTVAGKPSDHLAPGTLKSIARQSGLRLP